MEDGEDYPFEGPGGDGQLRFALEVEPVSLQSKPAARAVFDGVLADKLQEFDFLIDSQVSLTVRWWGVPRLRWETDVYPDLDNWLKPLIDAFVGPSRLLVDDSLIRSVDLSFGEGLVARSQLDIALSFDAQHRLPKQGLVYVHFERGLCFPFVGSWSPEAAEIYVSAFRSQLETKRRLEGLSVHSAATTLLLRNGWIHKSRLRGFAVVDAVDFLDGTAIE